MFNSAETVATCRRDSDCSHAVELLWQTVKKVLTISARDFTVVSDIQEHEGRVYTAGMSVRLDAWPAGKDKAFVRGQVHCGGTVMAYDAESSTLTVHYYTQVDVKGSFPDWVIAAGEQGAIKMVKKLTDLWVTERPESETRPRAASADAAPARRGAVERIARRAFTTPRDSAPSTPSEADH
jgi:hypothetical protein